MSAVVIDGKEVAADVVETVKAATGKLVADTGVTPGIAVVIVGEDPASQVYVRSKGKKATECGFHSLTHTLPAETPEADLLRLVEDLNNDPAIDGILVQLPLPDHIDEGKVIQTIAPEKDVDGFHFINVGKLGTGETDTAFVPCTPAGSMVLLKTGTRQGRFVRLECGSCGTLQHRGQANGQSTACKKCDRNHRPFPYTGSSRTGRAQQTYWLLQWDGPEMIKADWVKPGAVVIDVGINRIDATERGEGKTRLVGDVAYEESAEVAGSITPVPGGVGPMTIAMLMANTLAGACRRAGVEPPSY